MSRRAGVGTLRARDVGDTVRRAHRVRDFRSLRGRVRGRCVRPRWLRTPLIQHAGATAASRDGHAHQNFDQPHEHLTMTHARSRDQRKASGRTRDSRTHQPHRWIVQESFYALTAPPNCPSSPRIHPSEGRGLGRWGASVEVISYFFGAWCSAKPAPCVSVSCATRPPPGTSIGPFMTFAPFFLARPIAESRSEVSV